VILVDNTLWSRQVLDPAAEERDTVALRAFNRAVADDPRVRCVIVPMGDGVTVLQRVSG
jgi:predicted O-methyltransferase YrrM